jgi:O-antigen ligase
LSAMLFITASALRPPNGVGASTPGVTIGVGAPAPWVAIGVFCALAAWCFVQTAVLGAKPSAAGNAVLMFLGGAAACWLAGFVPALAVAFGLLAAASLNLLIGLLQFAQVAVHFHPWLNASAEAGMVYGNVRQPNQFASVMSMGLAALWWFARAEPVPAKPRLVAWVTVVMALGFVTGIVLSASRAGALQLVLIAIAAIVWSRIGRGSARTLPKSLLWTYALLPVAYVLIWLALRELAPQFGLTLRAGLERSVDNVQISRLDLWRNVGELIRTAPLLGVFGYGVGELGFAHFMHDFGNHRHMELIDNAHNVLLHAWVEIGLVGMLLAAVPFAWGALKAKPWAEASGTRQMAWLVVACLLLHSGLEYPLHYAQFWLPFCVCLGLVFTNGDKPEDKPGAVFSANRRRSALLAAGAFFAAAFVYLAWDYDRVSQAYGGPHRRAVNNDSQPLVQAQKSRVFRAYALFAKVTTLTVTPDNAAQMLPELLELLHFSAEPRVLDRLVTAQLLLGNTADARAYARRYKAAFPVEFATYFASLNDTQQQALR